MVIQQVFSETASRGKSERKGDAVTEETLTSNTKGDFATNCSLLAYFMISILWAIEPPWGRPTETSF